MTELLPDEDVADESGYVSIDEIENAVDTLSLLHEDFCIEGIRMGSIVAMLNELLERRDADEPMDDAIRYALGAM